MIIAEAVKHKRVRDQTLSPLSIGESECPLSVGWGINALETTLPTTYLLLSDVLYSCTEYGRGRTIRYLGNGITGGHRFVDRGCLEGRSYRQPVGAHETRKLSTQGKLPIHAVMHKSKQDQQRKGCEKEGGLIGSTDEF